MPFTRLCGICKSPLRAEIEELVRQGITPAEISRKYYQQFNIQRLTFYNKLRNHIRKKHPPTLTDNNLAVVPGNEAITFEDFAEQLLKLGFQNLINSKKVSPAHVIAAQKLLIMRKQLKLDNQQETIDKLMFSMLRGKKVTPEVEKE